MGYKIESKHKLSSSFLPESMFTKIHEDRAIAVAIAIEGVDDPKTQEVKVIDLDSGEVIFNSTEEDYE